MKVLDKVYIHLTPHLGLLEATEIPVDAPNEQEYIRKEALMEWLEQNKNQAQMWFDRYNDREDLSAKQVWGKVIGKLNEM